MTEKKQDDPKLERMGNYYPPIINCQGGIDGDSLHGVLTYEEIQDIKQFPIAREIKDQQALGKKLNCGERGEVEIAYYPETSPYYLRSSIMDLTIGALCLNTDCEHNLSRPAKKY